MSTLTVSDAPRASGSSRTRRAVGLGGVEPAADGGGWARGPRPVVGSPTEGLGVRLTRRGRAVLVLSLLAGLLVGGFVFGAVSSSHAAGTSSRSVVVTPGDTLWSIAARVAPERDTREVVAQLERANHLAGASVQVGEHLAVPS